MTGTPANPHIANLLVFWSLAGLEIWTCFASRDSGLKLNLLWQSQMHLPPQRAAGSLTGLESQVFSNQEKGAI